MASPGRSPEFSPLALADELTPLPEYKAAGNTSLGFSGLLEVPVRLHEDLTSGCGGQLWPAGMVLAKHMLRYHRDRLGTARMSVPFHPPTLTDKTLLQRCLAQRQRRAEAGAEREAAGAGEGTHAVRFSY